MPYLTAEYPGINGQLKVKTEDFFVEEIPLYLPSGQGVHIYIEIEKRGMPTYSAIKKIARTLDIPAKLIGYAGLKDARAITRQTLSISNSSIEKVENLQIPGIKILNINRHNNKLKIGHLTGNRFIIRVRQVNKDVLPNVQEMLSILSKTGVPNFFGKQRFGNRSNTHLLGEMFIKDNKPEFIGHYLGRPQPQETEQTQTARQLVDEERWDEALRKWPGNLVDERKLLVAIVRAKGQLDKIFYALNKKMKRFFVSAFQSYLFNKLLVQRLDNLNSLKTGDIAYIHGKGASFIVEDTELEQPRADRFEISSSGPLFGSKLLSARGEPGEQEQAILADQKLSLDDFKLPGLKLRGVRRPYRFKLKEAKAWWDDDLFVSFELTSGSYATTVMAEIMKH